MVVYFPEKFREAVLYLRYKVIQLEREFIYQALMPSSTSQATFLAGIANKSVCRDAPLGAKAW
ncbi:hypothetical protein DN752_23205 [Echinicola strongylocentroti]|uniref:Uncharacterized protein n=1 Tax=Echinicola strongylocentroti TaxID=1795355 RepID=A0A2Z4IPU2_9BACT|nr:hypothetical protein DN752_23205 [Echinicola strongylocentroti]